MNNSKNSTKSGNLTSAFKVLASSQPENSLAFMFMSAFGMSLATLMVIINKVCSTGDFQVAILALTAGVQIRNHVTYVGADYAGVKQKYPELIIDGDRSVSDQFNYGALHAMGHMLAHLHFGTLAKKMLEKSGSCITGTGTNDSEAGKINKEMSESWSGEDKAAWLTWNASVSPGFSSFLGTLFEGMPKRATDFSTALQDRNPPRPTPQPGASSSSSAPAKPATKVPSVPAPAPATSLS